MTDYLDRTIQTYAGQKIRPIICTNRSCSHFGDTTPWWSSDSRDSTRCLMCGQHSLAVRTIRQLESLR